jgi:hypothetical protein
LPSERCGRVRPRLSHDRITDGDTPTRRATSPIFKNGLTLDDLIFHTTGPIRVFYGGDAFFLLDSAPASSLTLRDYSKVVAGRKL